MFEPKDEHYYVAIPFAVLLGGGIYYYLHKVTQKVEKKIIGDANGNSSK